MAHMSSLAAPKSCSNLYQRWGTSLLLRAANIVDHRWWAAINNWFYSLLM